MIITSSLKNKIALLLIICLPFYGTVGLGEAPVSTPIRSSYSKLFDYLGNFLGVKQAVNFAKWVKTTPNSVDIMGSTVVGAAANITIGLAALASLINPIVNDLDYSVEAPSSSVAVENQLIKEYFVRLWVNYIPSYLNKDAEIDSVRKL